MSQSDPNRIVRLIPLAVGGICGTLLMLNRLMTPELTTTQSRSDALGIFMGAILLLCGLLWQQIQPRQPDAVELIGEVGVEFNPNLSASLQTELAWASHSLLTNTPAKTLIVYNRGRTLMRRGVLSKKSELTLGTITKRALEVQTPIYLVNLKFYPGRVEFDYLPENIQGLICQPLGKNGLLILGANAPRSFTKQDEGWVSAIADKLTYSLESADGNHEVSQAKKTPKIESSSVNGAAETEVTEV
ncbi:MAG: cofactor assembly of complex C subunit B [Cyanobacteria bacterium P01_F01_bin.42]